MGPNLTDRVVVCRQFPERTICARAMLDNPAGVGRSESAIWSHGCPCPASLSVTSTASGSRTGPSACAASGVRRGRPSFILEHWRARQARLGGGNDARPCDCHRACRGAQAEPAPVGALESEPETPVRANQGRRPNDLERRAKRVLARRPGITGADLRQAREVSPRTGQKLLKTLRA